MAKRIRYLFLTLNMVVIAATLLAYISPLTHPGKSSIPAVMGLLFPILFILNILFAFIWLGLKKYYALLSIAVLALGWMPIKSLINVSKKSQTPEPASLITVASFNAHQLVNLDPKRRPNESQMLELKKDLRSPDILCVQEGGVLYKHKESMGYKFMERISASNSILLSNYPILKSEALDLSPHKSLSGWFDIDIEGETVRLFLLHLKSNRITMQSERLMEEGSISDTETWTEVGNLVVQYAQAAEARAEQANTIRRYIDDSPHPIIVCGDFNDVPTSYTLAKIKGDLTDSFVAAGWGFGTTYAGKVPGLRIDYILTDPKIDVFSHEVLKLGASDHYPVIARVHITDL